MIKKNQQSSGFILKINDDSQIKEVVFGREVNLKFGKKSESYIFIVLNNLDSDIILIAANQSDGVITADRDDLIVYLNAKAEEMLGWSQKEARGKKCTEIFKILIEKNNDHNIEIISGEISEAEELKIDLSAALVEKTQGKVIIFREISQRKDMEAQLKKYAATDRLIEVLNRRAGLDYLKDEMEKAEKTENTLSLIFIDVNDLKLVNDNFGHQEGDELLQMISKILQHSLRQDDKVVRLGGDEFLLILPQSNKRAAEKVWLRIEEKLKQAAAANEKDYEISASHGAAEYSPDYQKSLDQLINQADHEMYEEKKKIKSESDIR
ncbi:PAS domain S-box-containing protein/diguanylate cyclase (GGDEF)-like protein [Halanaerobium saccharolyticum]|uniref:PAS domain S-box-containing protein/diguanylate cyclase (GGDEF)-like protein n=1 Tax=Halanaerobium saccharolyticum TaxID=43595 RepID=A0A4R6LHM0_9FIRM|nr:GGDEF domain-containing protein [Halanaerobium saccharolyticum]TDO83414.1 PAS domain S-box-containing protein/diguanylate cyclase (GGDEF)-like protein [Halanaerobium saccharolyticum]